jgi:very-short-patch-repair endonuclease
MYKILFYDKHLKTKASYLRSNSTKAEISLWMYLKSKQLGYSFTRQKPIGRYIVDFYCNKLGLAIEIDGDSHYGKLDYDLTRERYLNSFGVKVIRFSEKEVLHSLDDVLTVLIEKIESISVLV